MRLISCYDSPTSQQLTCQFHVGLRLPVAAIRVPCGGRQSCTGGAVQPPPHSRWEHRGPMRRRRAGEWGVGVTLTKPGACPDIKVSLPRAAQLCRGPCPVFRSSFSLCQPTTLYEVHLSLTLNARPPFTRPPPSSPSRSNVRRRLSRPVRRPTCP